MKLFLGIGMLCILLPCLCAAQEVTPPAPAGSSATTTSTTTSAGTAAAAPAKPDALPRDTSTQWKIGITVFAATGLSPDNAYLAYSLPLLLKNQLSGLLTHTYSSEDKERLQRSLIASEVAAGEKALTAARRDRDQLFFDRAPWATRTTVLARLKTAEDRLRFLRGLDPDLIQVPDDKPVSIVEGSGPGKLLPLPAVPPQAFCTQQGLDLLISGSLEEVQGFLSLDVWAWDPLTGSRIFSARNAASRDELYASLPAFGQELARTILGRSWAVVDFEPDPSSASLYVDGTLVTAGATPVLYLAPGTHEIRVAATGYEDTSRTLVLQPESRTRIVDTLSRLEVGRIEVTSSPLGADLYLDSLWMGRTPLSLQRPAVRSRGVLSLQGFYDSTFSLDPSSPPQMSFSLQKDVGSRDAAQKSAREDFYRALGFFALSVPLPVFFYGMYIDSQVRELDLSFAGQDAEAAREHTAGVLFQGIYYGGVGVSAALFVWMVTRIVRYVDIANEIAG